MRAKGRIRRRGPLNRTPACTPGASRKVLTAAAVTAGGVALVAGLDMATYGWWQSWCRTWGATDDEVARTLAGDELLADPDIVTTRAVWIAASPDAIWPWLVQMGPGRGGAYTYDWIENLFGLGMHSADEILAQYQDLKVGDEQRLGASGPVLRVVVLDPERSLVVRSDDGNWVWAFWLEPAGTGTRLISRNRIATPGASRLVRALYTYLMEPGSLVMERKMLLGIKLRAERQRARNAGRATTRSA
jgi:hypothetical protein